MKLPLLSDVSVRSYTLSHHLFFLVCFLECLSEVHENAITPPSQDGLYTTLRFERRIMHNTMHELCFLGLYEISPIVWRVSNHRHVDISIRTCMKFDLVALLQTLGISKNGSTTPKTVLLESPHFGRHRHLTFVATPCLQTELNGLSCTSTSATDSFPSNRLLACQNGPHDSSGKSYVMVDLADRQSTPITQGWHIYAQRLH